MESRADWYRRYLERCNQYRFDTLGEFVAEDVVVNDAHQGLAAHFTDTGTHRGDFLGVPATGRAVTTTELAVYHVEHGRIARAWVTADNLTLLDQLRG